MVELSLTENRRGRSSANATAVEINRIEARDDARIAGGDPSSMTGLGRPAHGHEGRIISISLSLSIHCMNNAKQVNRNGLSQQ
jgi:hypothetical protein